MINTLKIPTLGIGFGARAEAVIGLISDNVIPPSSSCGTVCCSIITGHFGLGCTPIVSKFDLNYGCKPLSIPLVVPEPGGGSTSYGGFYVPLQMIDGKHRKPGKQKIVTITIELSTGQKWEDSYLVDLDNSEKSVQILNIGGLVKSTLVIDVTNVALTNKKVLITFNTDK